jgi:hypothetical protein
MVMAIVVSLLLAPQAARSGAQDAVARVRELAAARLPRAQAAARDPDVVAAVAESNTRAETLADIQRKDATWIAQRVYPLRKLVIGRPCSIKLRKLVSDDPSVVEAFAMDDRGALVCSTVETSDYWQGDELKWIRTFQQGRDVFVDEPALDASTGVYAVQLSVPMGEGERRVGAVTFTLKLRRKDLAK